MTDDIKIKVLLGLGVVACAYFFLKKNAVQSLTSSIVAGVGNVIVGAGEGAVLGIGDAIGIPRTDETECEKAIREGRMWDASFDCPAGTFLKALF